MKAPRVLKARQDGSVNITLDGDVANALEAIRVKIGERVGFSVTKSQAVKHLIHSYVESTKEMDEGLKGE